MKLTQRIERLEVATRETQYRRYAEQLSEEWGIPAERLFHQFMESADRIEREGLDAEVRHLAHECGWTEEEAWRRYEEALAEVRESDGKCD